MVLPSIEPFCARHFISQPLYVRVGFSAYDIPFIPLFTYSGQPLKNAGCSCIPVEKEWAVYI